MNQIAKGVKGIVRKGNHFLVLVKPDGLLDLPGGRVKNHETYQIALRREIDEETGLEVVIQKSIEEWRFYKNPNLLIKGITFVCDYQGGTVQLSGEHQDYFWAGINRSNRLKFRWKMLINPLS